jgi:hypothetical protein
MEEVFPALLIGLLGAALFLAIGSRYTTRELVLLLPAYATHVVAGFVQVLITLNLYGSGDLFGYARRGEELAAALAVNFQDVGWELVKLLFQQEAYLPISITGIGSSTGSMTAIAAFIAYLTGSSVYAACVLLGVCGFFGKLLMYEVFRESFPVELHRRLLIANMLVPSVVFWSSGLLKESVAIVGLGVVILGMHRVLSGKAFLGFLLLIFGSITIGLVKAYILFAFVIAAGAWIYAARAWRGGSPRVRPLHLVLALGVALAGVVALGSLFPQYAVESLADQAALHQEIGNKVRGGSTYALIDEASETGAGVQLLYAPAALLTSLYRPLLFESSNAQVLINALETTTLLLMSLWVIARVRLRVLWATIAESPIMMFCVVFVVVFGTAVGLTSTNLGTLSRYRVPLVPLFASLLVVFLSARQRIAARPTAPGLATVLPPPVPSRPRARGLPRAAN